MKDSDIEEAGNLMHKRSNLEAALQLINNDIDFANARGAIQTNKVKVLDIYRESVSVYLDRELLINTLNSQIELINKRLNNLGITTNG